jgi:hypothetical protein
MKNVFRTFLFHLMCIAIFTVVYYFQHTHFINNKENENERISKPNLIDFIELSTTLQAGVGLTDLSPTTTTAKILTIIQQLIMISTHIFTIYIFTI